jgi:hypothetical protein
MFRSVRTVVLVGAAVTTGAALVLVALPASASSTPTISSFTPTAAAVGAEVTIHGSGLADASAVAFNFVAAPIATDTDTEITTTVPLGDDQGPVTVTTPEGTASSTSIFSLVGFYVTTTSLPDATPGFAYSQQLQAAGGTEPYRWTLTGTLPRGMVMTRTGFLSGVPSLKKAVPGTYSFTVSVRDSTRHHRQVATQAFSVTVS